MLALLGRSTGALPLGDFGSFFASGLSAAQGLDAFDVYPLTLDANLGRGHGAAVNLNAPVSVVLFQAIAGLDVQAAREGWFVATLVAYALMVGLLLRAYPASRRPFYAIWPLALAGFWETVNLGQMYVFLSLLTTSAWLLLGRRPEVAGLLLGAVVGIKPNFVVWPLLLLLAGERRAALVALGTAALLALIPVGLYGPRVYAQWLAALSQEGLNAQVANASLAGALVRFGAPPQVGLAAATFALLVTAAWVWWQRPPVTTTSGIALGALLLCVPRLLLEDWADTSSVLRMTLGSTYTVAWALLLYEYLAPRLVESLAPAHVAQW